MQSATECELIGPTLPAQEVADPLSSQPIISESLETFTSLLHTTLDGFHFIFAGTDGGELFQVWDIMDLLERIFLPPFLLSSLPSPPSLPLLSSLSPLTVRHS